MASPHFYHSIRISETLWNKCIYIPVAFIAIVLGSWFFVEKPAFRKPAENFFDKKSNAKNNRDKCYFMYSTYHMCSRLIALITKLPWEFRPKTLVDAQVNGSNSRGGLLSEQKITNHAIDIHNYCNLMREREGEVRHWAFRPLAKGWEHGKIW